MLLEGIFASKRQEFSSLSNKVVLIHVTYQQKISVLIRQTILEMVLRSAESYHSSVL